MRICPNLARAATAPLALAVLALLATTTVAPGARAHPPAGPPSSPSPTAIVGAPSLLPARTDGPRHSSIPPTQPAGLSSIRRDRATQPASPAHAGGLDVRTGGFEARSGGLVRSV